MLEQLLLNTRIHLLFFARNRLLMAFGVVMLLLFCMTFLPMLLLETSSDRFNTLRAITSQMSGYALVFVATLGLFAVSSHLRNRNVKLVLTINYQGSPMTITYTGVVDGKKMSGDADFGGLATGTWSAVKK